MAEIRGVLRIVPLNGTRRLTRTLNHQNVIRCAGACRVSAAPTKSAWFTLLRRRPLPIQPMTKSSRSFRLLILLAPSVAGLLLAGTRESNVLMTRAAAQSYDRQLFGELRWRNIGPLRGGRAKSIVGVPREPGVVS